MNLQTSIQYLKGVGEKRAALLRRLGIATLGDLLAYVPRAYEDWQMAVPIKQAPLNEPVCVRAIVDHAPTEHMIRAGMTLYKTRVTDGESVMGVTIFNSGYQAEKLKEGTEYLFYGRVTENFYTNAREMNSPQIAPITEARLRPIYPLTEGLSSRQLETLVERAWAQAGASIKEFLPEELLAAHGLMPRHEAMRAIHRPGDAEEAARARRRLAWGELFTLQLGLRLLRRGREDERAAPLPPAPALEFLSKLPFTPTGAQSRAVEEAARDAAREHPMHRLLQGDVGSGKTAVAAALLYQAARAGAQAAMMAPTELLARQHHATLQKLGLEPALLIGSTPAAQKKKIKAGLADGTIPLAVGTHALLQKDVAFQNLALIIVDEQHRFGVEQRNRIQETRSKNEDSCLLPLVSCHSLVMSATPIPRSLAMIIYGDLDISVLDELPPGRTPVETYCVDSSKRARAYNYVKKHLDAGQQGYIVCPRIAEDDKSELTAATAFYEELRQGAFAGYNVGLLHGRLSAKQKEQVMEGFAAGEVQLLVATTVIEVGVDVPGAAIMVIENAERFGLSQLHQLRGRVGRGAARSTCILISDAENGEARGRLAVMRETVDGFEIARRDLELRGPGDFFGARQHGLPELRLADIADAALLQETRAAVEGVWEKDPGLEQPEHRAMRRVCERLF